MFFSGNVLLQMFALEGFVKAQLAESLPDTILSPSCTVRCTGVVESLVFLYIYITECIVYVMFFLLVVRRTT